MEAPGHTEAEQDVINATMGLVRLYRHMETTEGADHPSHWRDVADAVHVIQRTVAMRLARRVDPEAWE